MWVVRDAGQTNYLITRTGFLFAPNLTILWLYVRASYTADEDPPKRTLVTVNALRRRHAR